MDVINRQAVLCHRVLRTLQHTAQVSTILTRETWEALLLFLLAINQILLSPPTVKGNLMIELSIISEILIAIQFQMMLVINYVRESSVYYLKCGFLLVSSVFHHHHYGKHFKNLAVVGVTA